MDDLIEFICVWLVVVGGFTLFLFTLRLLAWLVDVLLLGGW